MPTGKRSRGPAAGGSCCSTHARLEALYSEHNPDKLPELDTLIAKYGGRQLLAKAARKYSCPEAAGGGSGSEGGSADEEEEEEEEEVITGGLRAALALRTAASTPADVEAFEAALRQDVLDEAVSSPPATQAGGEAVLTGLRQLALLLCQTGRDAEACMHVRVRASMHSASQQAHYISLPAAASSSSSSISSTSTSTSIHKPHHQQHHWHERHQHHHQHHQQQQHWALPPLP